MPGLIVITTGTYVEAPKRDSGPIACDQTRVRSDAGAIRNPRTGRVIAVAATAGRMALAVMSRRGVTVSPSKAAGSRVPRSTSLALGERVGLSPPATTDRSVVASSADGAAFQRRDLVTEARVRAQLTERDRLIAGLAQSLNWGSIGSPRRPSPPVRRGPHHALYPTPSAACREWGLTRPGGLLICGRDPIDSQACGCQICIDR